MKYLICILAILIASTTVYAQPDSIEYQYQNQLAKPVLCSPKMEVWNMLEEKSFEPAIRFKGINDFYIYIFMKQSMKKYDEVSEIKIFEVDPMETIACLISEGYGDGTLQFNRGFWDKLKGLSI